MVAACGFTDLLSLDADEDGLLPIRLAAAETEDVGNLEGTRREDELCPGPVDNLNMQHNIKQCVTLPPPPRPAAVRCSSNGELKEPTGEPVRHDS